jgi:PTH1 family peptidyl-tRNA hydrolase
MITLIVGLGNVGRKYQKARHNLGFEVIDTVIKNSKTVTLPEEAVYESFRLKSEDREIIMAKPTTMMNGSGRAVRQLLEKTGLNPGQMLVIVDDFNIPLGTTRLRKSGSAGGHNGLDSIINELQTERFPRLRLGIGPLSEKAEIVDFVLEKFTRSERKIVDKMIEIAAEAVIFAAGHRFEETISKYNYNPV